MADQFVQLNQEARGAGVLIRPESVVAVLQHRKDKDGQEYAMVTTADGKEYSVQGNWQEVANKIIGALGQR